MIDGRRNDPPGAAKAAADGQPEAEAEEAVSDGSVAPAPQLGAGAERPADAPPAEALGNRRLPLPRIELGRRLFAIGVSADHVTAAGILLAAVTGVVIGLGYLYVGVALVTVGGLMDTLDGAVAKAAGSASKRGAFFDSVSDRVADAFIFGGVAWFFIATHRPHLALLPFAILGVSNTISYERAKAESLGYVAKGGLMERAERLILLGLALVLNMVLVPLLWALLGLSILTMLQRFAKVWRQASADTPAAVKAASAGVPAGTPALSGWRTGRVESRWRAWREVRTDAVQSRRRVTISSRPRSRRSLEPLSTRLRKVLTTERSVGARTGRRSGPRQRGTAAAAFRRRLGADR